MAKRLKLSQRILPIYSKGEEIMNMVTHIVGGAFAVVTLVLCLLHSGVRNQPAAIFSCSIYGISMVTVYAISSVYHGLRRGTAKKVLQILDHCAIYLLIAGTYTPIMVCAFMPQYPFIARLLLIIQWGLAALAIILTAIDLKKFKVFSMFCYIALGWSIIFFLPQALIAIGKAGFALLLAGGISYSVGAILFGIGAKVRWMHCIFHIFVVLGSILQFLSIYLYVL